MLRAAWGRRWPLSQCAVCDLEGDVWRSGHLLVYIQRLKLGAAEIDRRRRDQRGAVARALQWQALCRMERHLERSAAVGLQFQWIELDAAAADHTRDLHDFHNIKPFWRHVKSLTRTGMGHSGALTAATLT